jgi:hypothetical protein
MPKDELTSHKKSHKKEKKKLKPVYIDTDQPIDALKAGSPHPPISRPEEKAIAGSDALVNEIAVPNSMVPSVGGRDNSRYAMFRCTCRNRRILLLHLVKPFSCLMPADIITSHHVHVTGPCRLELGPHFEPVQVEPALECSDFDADTHELWLLQLPLDVWCLISSARLSCAL